MSKSGTYLNGSGAGLGVEYVTPDVGGQVSPDGTGNLNILGGIGITTSSNTFTNTLYITATQVKKIVAVTTTPYVAALTDDFMNVETAFIPITIQLPDPNIANVGDIFVIKDGTNNAVVNNITVTTVSGIALFDNIANNYVMNTNTQAISVISTGVNYLIF